MDVKKLIILTVLVILSYTVSAAHCGDGKAEGGEQCDSNDLRGYSCGTICYLDKDNPKDYNAYEQHNTQGDFYCGSIGSITCNSSCKIKSTCHYPQCGDGITEGTEECDDGSANSDSAPDACRTICVLPRCGDYAQDSNEQCDDGPYNSDEIPNRCRKNCMQAHCGDGVLDEGEACDDGNTNDFDGCSECRECIKPKDDLEIATDARICPGDYQLADANNEGVIIITGSGITVICDDTRLYGPGSEMLHATVIDSNMAQQIVTTTQTTLPKKQLNKDITSNVLNPTTSTTIKPTTTTIRTYTPPTIKVQIATTSTTTTLMILTHIPGKSATTSTSTTLKNAFTTLTIPNIAIQPTPTTIPLTETKFKQMPLYANPQTSALRFGTGIRITGNDVLLIGCDVSNYRTGVKISGSGNILVQNKLCDNSKDIDQSSGNYGTANTCNSATNWAENGQSGCTFTCGQDAQQTTPTTQTTTSTQPKGETEDKGIVQRILSIFT